MKRLAIAAVGLALVVGVACGETGPSQPTPTPAARPPATAELSPAARNVTVADAPHYLDVGSVLPGFRRIDPAEAGVDPSQIGPDASLAAYLSEQPFQSLIMYSEVLTNAVDKASTKAEMRGDTYPETFLTSVMDPVAQQLGGHLVKTDIQWSDPRVGDIAHLASVRAEVVGGTADIKFLIFLQEQGTGMALVSIYSFSLADEPAAVDVLTVGKEISAKIANP